MSILRMPAVKAATGHRSHASIYTAIKEGLFTTGVAIGQRSKGWPSEEVFAINAARIAGKSETEIRQLVRSLHAKRTELAKACGLAMHNNSTLDETVGTAGPDLQSKGLIEAAAISGATQSAKLASVKRDSL